MSDIPDADVLDRGRPCGLAAILARPPGRPRWCSRCKSGEGHASGREELFVNAKTQSSGIVVAASPGVYVEGDPMLVSAPDLQDLVREEFAQQGDLVPSEEQVIVLSRVVAGYLRTSPLPHLRAPEGHLLVASSFVAACLGWWTRDVGDHDRLASLLEDVFHQRESGLPGTGPMEILIALGVGLLRQRQVAPSHPAQLAIADWIATLYLAGADDW